MYRFCLVCVCVCVCVRVPKTNNFITTSHFAFTWGFGPIQACPSVRLFICQSVPRCLSGAFCPFNGLRSTPNHFQTLPGHADHHMDQFLACDSYAKSGICRCCVSVCLSVCLCVCVCVCLSHSGIVSNG